MNVIPSMALGLAILLSGVAACSNSETDESTQPKQKTANTTLNVRYATFEEVKTSVVTAQKPTLLNTWALW